MHGKSLNPWDEYQYFSPEKEGLIFMGLKLS